MMETMRDRTKCSFQTFFGGGRGAFDPSWGGAFGPIGRRTKFSVSRNFFKSESVEA
jgi:hypothetical protein